MARGWESKEVESQIEEARERLAQPRARPRSAEEIAAERERESLELTRSRLLSDIAAATNPKYQALLKRSLEFIDAKLASLNEPTSGT